MTTQNDGFDYMAEADKTCSVEWHPEHVNRETFFRTLREFAETAAVLNLYKKLLFRGKTPSELNMQHPDCHNSLVNVFTADEIDVIHGIIGVATESGEVVEMLIERLLVLKPFDTINAVEEAGDLRWYINRILRWAGVTDEQCERANIAKLHGRGFANGFDMFADANRNLDNERAILDRATGVADARAEVDRTLALPLGPHGDEDLQELGYRKGPIGDCEGMDC